MHHDDIHLSIIISAGSSVVLHKDSAWKESWKNFKENSALMQSKYLLK
jgi:import inner membrane translocase subunit TIM44